MYSPMINLMNGEKGHLCLYYRISQSYGRHSRHPIMVDGFNKVKTFDLRDNQGNSNSNSSKSEARHNYLPPVFLSKEEEKIVWKISYNKVNSCIQNVVQILFVERMRLYKINKKGSELN